MNNPIPSSTFDPNKWSYDTPLEQPTGNNFTVEERVIELNGMKFQKRSDCKYQHDYYTFFDNLEKFKKFTPAQKKKYPHYNGPNFIRNMIQDDLWFIVYFVMKNPLANHPFIVEACKEIQAERGDSLEVWARDHLKTTIITVARQVQKVLNDPERRIGIFCAVRPLAVKILNLIRKLLESEFLYTSFPDILHKEPYKEADRWTDAPDGGLIVKRQGFYKEPTFSAWGLVEGMPTGDHYTDMVFDDIVTQDLQSPEMTQKVKDNFDMAENIGTRDCQSTVVGTFYRHDDALTYIRDKTDVASGEKLFKFRKKPATIDGTLNGESSFLPEKKLAKKRAGQLYMFYCQQLVDPTPRGSERLNKDHLVLVKKKDLPTNLYKFMLIDGAGDEGRRRDGRDPDAWGLAVVGVEPYRDELGASRMYILDLIIEKLDLVTAQQAAVDMYLRNGRILKLGIEKVGLSTTEIHICSALRAKGRYLSVEQGNLEILRPGGRSKEYRIESALAWPLKNSKLHILDTIPVAYRERLGLEMEKFPAWHNDGLDALSYGYDIIKGYRFGEAPGEIKKEGSYDTAFRKARELGHKSGWISV